MRSRCLCIRVAAPSDEAIAAQLGTVAAREKVELPQALAQKIAEASERNLRRALLSLEVGGRGCSGLQIGRVGAPAWLLSRCCRQCVAPSAQLPLNGAPLRPGLPGGVLPLQA